MNTVALIGRLTADIEVRETKGKEPISVCNFSLAVPRIGSEETDFIRCTAFGKTAEFLDEWMEKGDRIGVVGRIQTGSYENKDKQTVYTTDVIVERVDFADGKKEDTGRSGRKGRK